MANDRKIELEWTIAAGRERIFEALTADDRLRDWLCDRAWTEPYPGGRCVLRWYSGYEVQGSFVEVDFPEEITLIWQGRGDPGPTLVEWELEEEDGATEISLEHTGFGTGPQWDVVYDEAERGWEAALENLKSIIEEGVDLRETRRPFLGIMLEEMTPERAAQEEIAAEQGIYVTGVVEDGAAAEAGLHMGDVLVELAGRPLTGIPSLITTLRGLQAGDTTSAGVVRGQERLDLEVQLQGREMPEVPDDPQAIVARLRERHAELNGMLVEVTQGVTDDEAGRAPAEGEWSVKEILAHLSITERELQQLIDHIVNGALVEGGDGGPWQDRIAAIVSVEQTLAGLLARLAHDQEETVALVEHLSPEVQADTYRYRRAAQVVLQYTGHTEEHVEHIRQTVEAVQGE